MKKSFILHLDSLLVLSELTDEQAGILFKAISNYHLDIETELDFGLKMAFLPFKNQFIRDRERYLNESERNSLNGKKGGRPKKATKSQKTQVVLEKAKKGDSDSDSDNGSDNDKEKDSERIKFIPPSYEEVWQYFYDNSYTAVAAKKAFDYYEASNWVDSRGNKVKNWKQKMISVWFKDENKKEERGFVC